MTSFLDSAEFAALHSQSGKPLPANFTAFNSGIGMLKVDARDNLIKNSSVREERSESTNVLSTPHDTAVAAVSCGKSFELPDGVSTDGPSPQDANGFPNLETQRSADDDDRGRPLRMRAVLRTLFQAAEPVGSSIKDPNIENGSNHQLTEFQHSDDNGQDETLPDDDIFFAVTNKVSDTKMEKKSFQAEMIKREDEDMGSESTGHGNLKSTETGTTHDVPEEPGSSNNVDIRTVKISHEKDNLSFANERSNSSIDTETSPVTAVNFSRPFDFTGLNHVAFCCENLEKALEFYCGLLGLTTSPDRPELPYRGAWLVLGAEGIHIMEVPNPDPVFGRPGHGGFDRHACLNCRNVDSLRTTLEKAGVPYQISMVPSVFCRDPDGNGLEFIEISPL